MSSNIAEAYDAIKDTVISSMSEIDRHARRYGCTADDILREHARRQMDEAEAIILAEIAMDCEACSQCSPCGSCQQGAPCESCTCEQDELDRENDPDRYDDYDDYDDDEP